MRGLRLALASLCLAACGGGGTDIAADIRFADLTDLQIARMINAASGSDMFGAEAQIDQYGDSFRTDPCPQIEVSGTDATITGGCTTTDGLDLAGSVTVSNPRTWDQIDYLSGDSLYELDAFSQSQTGFAQSWDGEITLGGDFLSWDADLTVEQTGSDTVRSDIHYRCNASTTTCALRGSGVELIGIGGAHASGTVTVSGQTETADYTLEGEDTLTVTVANGCVAWQIEGTDRQMACP
jgi:hypothetical protein